MTGKPRTTKIVTGLHIVKKPLKGFDRYYIYAWRKGPCIHKHDGNYPVVTPAILAKQLKAHADKRKTAAGIPFDTIITAYSESPEYEGLSEHTKRNYRMWLDRISNRFGKVPIEVFEDRRMRGELMAWRDTFRSTPTSADQAITILSMLLNWAVDHTMLKSNPATRIKNINKTNKADKIWEPEHFEIFEAANPPQQLKDAVFLARMTGLRLSSLVAVEWNQVFPTAIKIDKGMKRNGRAVIPILPELRTWLEARPHKEGPILRNSRGYHWTASGLGSVFQKKQPANFDRTMHDLRGTFATRLIIAGLTDEQVAMVLGWTAKRIAAIRARYVDEERVIISLAEKIAKG
jgi:integrase